MASQEKINTAELNIIASLVEDYCTTPESTTSKAVERILLELELANASVKLLTHKVDELEQNSEEGS